MSLVDQIFEQAKLGTAPNPDANPFAGGLQLGLQQQHLNQQAQELAMEIAQAPLKQTLLQQSAQMNALKIEQGLRDNEDAIEGHSLMAQYSQAMKGANLLPIDVGLRVHSQFGLDHPVVLNNPEYKEAGKELDDRVKQASIESYRLTLADAAQTRAEAAQLKAQLEAKGKAEVMPKLVNVGGLNYIVNSKTGHFEPVNKTESKSAFISKHLLNFSKDNMVDPKEAAAKLGELYDSMIVPASQANPAGTVVPPTATGAVEPAAPIAAPAVKPSFEIGKTYIDKQGHKAVYRGDGLWTPLP